MSDLETAPAGPGDGELVRRMRGGSEDAAEELVRRHWPRAWRAAYAALGSRAAAEDAAQEAVARAMSVR